MKFLFSKNDVTNKLLPIVDKFVRLSVTWSSFHDIRFSLFVSQRNGRYLICSYVISSKVDIDFINMHTMSVPRSMQRIVTVPSGNGMPTEIKAKNGESSGILDVSVYAMDFFKLSKIRRPSSTPVTIEAKLSSSKIMSAACLETSEPAIPMATP